MKKLIVSIDVLVFWGVLLFGVINANGATPTTQATITSISSILNDRATINWVKGNGARRAIFVKQTSNTLETVPLVDGTSYTANSSFSLGTQVGSTGWYCVYNNNAVSSATVITNLTANLPYQVMICEYNGTGVTSQYFTNTSFGNPGNFLTILPSQVSGLTFSLVTQNGLKISWINGDGGGRVVFVKQTSSTADVVSLTDGAAYTGNSTFGTIGTEVGASGWFCVYSGTSTNVTLTGLTANSSYRVMVCEYSNIGKIYNSAVSSGNTGNFLTLLPTQVTGLAFSLLSQSGLKITWANGNGAGRAVFIKQTTSTIDEVILTNGTTYIGNSALGTPGTEVGASGWFCVYSGTSTNVTLTGLTANSSYRVMVCEYSNPGIIYNSAVSSGNTGNFLTLLQTQVAGIAFSSVAQTNLTIAWSNGNGGGRAVFVKQTSNTVEVVSVSDGTAYSGNASFGTVGTEVGASGWYCVYSGTSNTVTLSSLVANSSYRVMICEYSKFGIVYNKNVSAGNTGNIITLPNQASGITFTNIGANNMDVSWTRGAGSTGNCAVFMRVTSSGVPTVTIGTNYSANPVFGSAGTQIGTSGWFCVFNGNGNSASISGLNSNTTYRVIVFEYNNQLRYNTATDITNPVNQLTLPTQAKSITFSGVTNNTFSVICVKGGGTNRLIFLKETTDITEAVSVVNKTTYTANPAFGNGSQAGTGWFCVYNGNSNVVPVTGLISNKQYQVMVIEYTGSAGNEFYNCNVNTLNPNHQITKKIQTISFVLASPVVFGSADIDPGATASSGLAVGYYSTNPSVATISGEGKIHINGLGSTDIKVTQIGNSEYMSTSITRTLVVERGTQTIIFNPIPNKAYGDEDFDVSTNTSSGLPLTYSSGDVTIATISATGRIHINKPGTVTIVALQSGNVNFKPASTSQTFTISKGDQTITFAALSDMNYADSYINPAFSSSNLKIKYTSDNPSVALIVGDTIIHIMGAGTANITASQAGNTFFKPAVAVNQLLSVLKTDQLISFDVIDSKTYNDPDFDLYATASSGLPISFLSGNLSIVTIIGSKAHIVGIGTTTITAAQAGNSNYNAATSFVRTIVVSKASQTITFGSIPEHAIDQPDFNLTVSSSSGLPLSYFCDNTSVATVDLSGHVNIIGTGTANITASQGGNSFFHPASNITQKLIVKTSSQTISFNALPIKTFGDIDFSISATSSSGLPVSFISDNTTVASVSGNVIHIVGGGMANIYAMQEGNDDYAAATPVSQQLIVGKSSQTLFFPDFAIKSYGDLAFYPSVSSSSGLTVEFESSNPLVALILDGKITILGVGTASITAYQGGNANYVPAPPVSKVLTVSKTSQTITFNSISEKTFGDPDFSLNATSSSGLSITYSSSNINVATIINGKAHIVNPGISTITATQTGDSNYNNATNKSQSLIVNKASQTIDFEPLPEVKYGCTDFYQEATSTSGLPVTFISSNTNIATVTSGYVHVLKTGSVNIIAMQVGNSQYNAATHVSQLLVVKKLSQMILFDSIPEKTYGDPDFDPKAIASSELAVTYSIDNPNVAVLKDGKVHIVGVGTAIITARQLGNINYNAADENVSRVIKINKAILNATPVSTARNYLEPDPIFTLDYSGFVNGETSSVISIPPIITTTAENLSFPGIYDLIASGGTDDHYSFTYQKGMLLILGTMPLKPAKPEGNSLLCINPADQVYKTAGSVFAYTYEWEMIPASAGNISGTGKTITANYRDDFSGRVAITVKASNNQGTGTTADTLFIDILPFPQSTNIQYRGTYCSANIYGDSIKIIDSQNQYQYQLNLNGEKFNDILTGNGGLIVWGDLKAGKYSINENICNVPLFQDLDITGVDPSSVKPQLEVKWNDVVVCLNNGDSIESYQWFKNGDILPDEIKQYIWTQKKEGYYLVKTIDINGCIFTSDSIWIDKQATGLIYPNPNQGSFKLSFNSIVTGKVSIRITNMNSFPVKSLSFNKADELFETDINIPELMNGTYYIEVLLNKERVFYNKFVRN